MQPNPSSKPSDSGRSPWRLLLSFGLPLLLLLAFLVKQIINFDSIGWSNGFSHPLTGWDHLLTMLAVGIWAAQLRGHAIWMLPLAFVGVMSLGGLAGAAGLAIPSVEGIILLSCAVFSILITRKVRFGNNINVLIVAFFGFFHGFAHGQEISTSASLISYTLGFMLATLLLHGAGILVAKLVVFSITCLLTIIFSNAALAKTAESIIDDKVKKIALVQGAGFTQITPFWLASDQTTLEKGIPLTEEKLRPEDFPRHGVGDGKHSDVTCKIVSSRADSVKSYSEEITANGHSYGLALKQAAFQALDNWQDKWPFKLDYMSDSGLDFKHFYPDINHTPGKHLLSNGVGLTSPPAAVFNVLAPQASHYPRKTSISFIEEPNLQLIFAKPQTGNSHTKTSNNSRHDCSIRNALQCAVTSVHCQNNFLSFLTPIDSSRPPKRLAVGVSSRLHLLAASPESLPLVVLETRPTKAFIIQT